MTIIFIDLFVTYCLLVTVNAIGIAVVALTQYTRRWTVPFAISSLLAAVWVISYVIEIRSDAFQTKLFLYYLRQTMIILTPTYWLFTALEMYFTPHRVPLKFKLGLMIIPLISILLIWTNSSHQLMMQQIFIDNSTPITLVKSIRGGFHWLSVLYIVLVGIVTLMLFFVQYQRTPSDERRIVAVLSAAFGLPSLLSLFDLIAPTSRLPFSLGLLAFLPAQLAVAWVYVLPLIRGRPTIGYDLMFEAMEDGVIVVNEQNQIIEINKAARRLFPLSMAFVGQPIDGLVSAWPLWKYAFQAQATTRFELKMGSTSYDIHTTPLHMADGKLLGYLCTMRDITRLIQSQEQLAASGERFRRLVTQMPFPLVLTKVEGGKILYVNPKAEEVFLIKNDDAQARFSSEFYADTSQRDELLRKVNVQGYAIAEDVLLKRSNGEEFWTTLSTVRTELDGESVLITSVNDISARKDMEERLRHSESLYRSIVTASPDGILTMNMQGIIQMASPSMLRLLGYSDDSPEMRGSTNIFAHIHPQDMQVSSNLLESFVTTGRINARVTRLVHRDGHVIYTEVNGELIYDKDKTPTGILLIVRDITERMEIEQSSFEARLQREKIVVIDRLIQSASHDLRTPITVITTAAYLQQKLGTRIIDSLTKNSDEQKNIINDLHKIIERAYSSESAARRLEQIVESMVEITRLESRIHLNLKPNALNPMLNDLIRSLQSRFEAKSLTLTMEQGVLPLIWMDAVEIRKAISKLLDNAYYYTPEGGYVHVDSRVVGDKAHIRISDNGIGIDTEDLKHVFDSFYRADPARSTNTGGAGLGLTIAQRICELHGGSIEVESTYGVGSTFTMILPLIPPETAHLRNTQTISTVNGDSLP